MKTPLKLKVRSVLLRIVPPYGVKKMMAIAEDQSIRLLNVLYTFMDINRISAEIKSSEYDFQCFIGFICGASDVLAQSMGGRPGSMASSNTALKVFNEVIPNERVMEAVEVSVCVRSGPSEIFMLGLNIGADFGNACFYGDEQQMFHIGKMYFKLKEIVGKVEMERASASA